MFFVFFKIRHSKYEYREPSSSGSSIKLIEAEKEEISVIWAFVASFSSLPSSSTPPLREGEEEKFLADHQRGQKVSSPPSLLLFPSHTYICGVSGS